MARDNGGGAWYTAVTGLHKYTFFSFVKKNFKQTLWDQIGSYQSSFTTGGGHGGGGGGTHGGGQGGGHGGGGGGQHGLISQEIYNIIS